MMAEEDFQIIREVPERLIGERALALAWLLKHATTVEMAQRPRGRSKYRAYFDDGAYKGGTRVVLHQQQLTPLAVYLAAAETGWPGLRLKWLAEAAENKMREELQAAPSAGGE